MTSICILMVGTALLILTGCDGEDFSKYLNRVALSWPIHRTRIMHRFRLAGKWLADFHRPSALPDLSGQPLELRRTHLVRMLKAVAAKAGGKVPGDAVLARFDSLVSDLASVPVALLHGNFALRNLLVSDQSVSAVDFEDSRRDCTYYDLGQLVAEVLVRGFFPTFTKSMIEDCRQNLIRGYAETTPIRNDVLEAFTGYHLIAFYYEHLHRGSKNSVVAYRRRHIGKEIKRWLSGLTDQAG